MGIEERIIVEFDVSKQGKIANAKVVRGQDKHLKAEALRLVNSMPDLIPAMHRGKAINCTFEIPISFTLE